MNNLLSTENTERDILISSQFLYNEIKTMLKLPSKRFIVAILIAVGITGVSFVISQDRSKTTNSIVSNGTEEMGLSQESSATKDSDLDGLYDWEESLWGTDMNDSDTDDDGTSDGDEVSQNRNPLIAGPNDVLYNNSDLVSPDTTEEEFSEAKQEFYSAFLQQRGEEIREMTVEALIQDFNAEEFSDKEKYSLSDLNTSSQSDEVFIRAYGNTLGEIFARYANKDDYPYDEVAIFGRSMQNKNSSELFKLEFVSLAYKNLAEDLLATEIPMSAAENHLLLVNGYDMLSETTDTMRFLLEDPLRSGLAYETYVGQTAVNQAIFFNLVLYFQNKDIIFNENEPGGLFNLSS